MQSARPEKPLTRPSPRNRSFRNTGLVRGNPGHCDDGLVRLLSQDGASVEVRPVRYQYGANPQAPAGTDWDANWLVIRGEIRTADGREWTFTDPCLTTWEVREIPIWLRSAANGLVQPAPNWSDEEELLHFTEPNIALSLQAYAGGRAQIRVHLSIEAAPPWLDGTNRPEMFEYFLLLDLKIEELITAAEEWANDCEPYPVR